MLWKVVAIVFLALSRGQAVHGVGVDDVDCAVVCGGAVGDADDDADSITHDHHR